MLVQGRCGERRMADEVGPEGGINPHIRPGEFKRGYDDGDSPRMSAGQGGCGDECEGKGYVVEHEDQGGGSSSNRSSTSSNKSLDETWDEHRRSPLTVATPQGHYPGT